MTKPGENFPFTIESRQRMEEAPVSKRMEPLRKMVEVLEKRVADDVGSKEAIVVHSRTAAMHLIFSLLGITKGDSVFCSTLASSTNAHSIVSFGAAPIFIDAEPESWNMSPQALKRALFTASRNGGLPKAVIVVHVYGQSPKLEELLLLCRQYNVPLIEDATTSFGTTYRGKASGTVGNFGIYAFHGNKINAAIGCEILVANDVASLKRARILMSEAGHNQTVNAFDKQEKDVLIEDSSQLVQQWKSQVNTSRNIFELYYHALADLPGVHFMPTLLETKPNRWVTALTINEEETGITVEQLLKGFYDETIEATYVWKPLHMQQVFKKYDYYSHEENEHVSEGIFTRGLCLPSELDLSGEEQLRVIKCFRDMLTRST